MPEGVAEREGTLADLAERILDIGLPDRHPWRGVGLAFTLPTAVERLMARLAELTGRLQAWQATQATLSGILEIATPPTFAATPILTALGRRVASAPRLEAVSLGGPLWADSVEAIVALIAVGREFERCSADLEERATPQGLDTPVHAAIAALATVPPEFGQAGFAHVAFLDDALPRLLSGADQLDTELGRPAGERTLSSLARAVETAERVAAAPDASPEAFVATIWDHGVEQAGDLADAVAALEPARRALGDSVNDAAWTTEVGAARQTLATQTGLLRKLNSEWRRANALVRSVVRNADVPLPELLERLDLLIQGQAALRTVKDGAEFGKAAFGADWRGERSASAPLVALVDWMRTLRGLGAEPRLIAGRMPQRSALGEMASILIALHASVRSGLEFLRSDAGGELPALFGDSLSADRIALTELAGRIRTLAVADQVASLSAPSAERAGERLEILRRIAARQDAARSIDDGGRLGTEAFGCYWQGRQSDWRGLAQAAHWVATNPDVRRLAARIPDRAALADMASRIETGQDDLRREFGEIFASLQSDAASLFGQAAIDTVPLVDLARRLAEWMANGESSSRNGSPTGSGRTEAESWL